MKIINMYRLFFLILIFSSFSVYATKFYGVYWGTHIGLALDSNYHYTISTSYHPIHTDLVYSPVVLSLGNYSIKGNVITLSESFTKAKMKLVIKGRKLFFISAIPYYQKSDSVLDKQNVYEDDLERYNEYIKDTMLDSSILSKCHDSVSHKILLGQKYGHWDYDIIFEPKTYKIYCYQTLFTDGTWKQDKNILFIKDNYTHVVHKWYIMNDSNIVTDFFPGGLIVFSTNASDE